MLCWSSRFKIKKEKINEIWERESDTIRCFVTFIHLLPPCLVSDSDSEFDSNFCSRNFRSTVTFVSLLPLIPGAFFVFVLICRGGLFAKQIGNDRKKGEEEKNRACEWTLRTDEYDRKKE